LPTKQDANIGKQVLKLLYDLYIKNNNVEKYYTIDQIITKFELSHSFNELNSSLKYIAMLQLIDLILDSSSNTVEFQINDNGISFVKNKKKFLEFDI
jgi:hypothetical protein